MLCHAKAAGTARQVCLLFPLTPALCAHAEYILKRELPSYKYITGSCTRTSNIATPGCMQSFALSHTTEQLVWAPRFPNLRLSSFTCLSAEHWHRQAANQGHHRLRAAPLVLSRMLRSAEVRWAVATTPRSELAPG